MKRIAPLVIVIGLAVAACGGGGGGGGEETKAGWTESFRDSVFASCKSQGASDSECECVVEYSSTHYSREELAGMDGDSDAVQDYNGELADECGV